jgi:hypothetical protein
MELGVEEKSADCDKARRRLRLQRTVLLALRWGVLQA